MSASSNTTGHVKKPSLPSIQFLLNDPIKVTPINHHQASPPVNHTKTHHRQSSSISSLPSELQQLSLSAPAYNIPERSENQQPSWMIMAPTSVPLGPTKSTSRTHGRSISDLSLVNLVTPTTPPLPQQIHRNRHQTHKRSFSANTTSAYTPLQSSPPNLPYIEEHTRHTASPPEKRNTSYIETPQQKQLFDALNIGRHPTMFLTQIEAAAAAAASSNNIKKQDYHHIIDSPPKEYENVVVARDEQTGRYYCPFCNKAFNRPSSLRIHTYTHTGEKPFVCQEEGCGRQFSVQSNMRRHLRVHRLGRSKAATKLEK